MRRPSRQLRIIGGIVLLNLVLVVGGWIAVVSPQRHDAAKAAAQAQQAQSQLAALSGGSSKGQVTQPTIHTADLYSLDTALPSQADQAALLFELSHVAKASGIQLTGISPEAAQATASGYTMQPINLQLNGSYFKMTDFLRNLRLLVSDQHGRLIAHGPLFAVASLTFNGVTSEGDSPATVGIQAFYYGVTAGATAPASTTATTTTTTGS
jgi:hypothetical protein